MAASLERPPTSSMIATMMIPTMLLPTTITAMDSAMALAATKPLHHRLHTPRSLIV